MARQENRMTHPCAKKVSLLFARANNGQKYQIVFDNLVKLTSHFQILQRIQMLFFFKNQLIDFFDNKTKNKKP